MPTHCSGTSTPKRAPEPARVRLARTNKNTDPNQYKDEEEFDIKNCHISKILHKKKTDGRLFCIPTDLQYYYSKLLLKFLLLLLNLNLDKTQNTKHQTNHQICSHLNGELQNFEKKFYYHRDQEQGS